MIQVSLMSYLCTVYLELISGEHMKVHISELQRMIWRYNRSSQLCTELKQLWNQSLKKIQAWTEDWNPWLLWYRCKLISSLFLGCTFVQYRSKELQHNMRFTRMYCTHITCTVRGWNSTNPAIWLVTEVGRIFPSSLLTEGRIIVLICFCEQSSPNRQSMQVYMYLYSCLNGKESHCKKFL